MTAYPDPQLNDSDLELLSAYIDQQLTATERAALDQRLQNEPALQLALDELRTTVRLLRDLPPAHPPRSFALDPQSVAPRRRWSFPWMQFGSALVAATLLLVFGFVLTRGIGSRGGGAPASAPMAAAAPTAAPAAAATAAPAAIAVPAAEPTAAAAAEAPAAGAAAPTAAAAPTTAPALSAAEAPEATTQPAAALAPAGTAAPAAPEAAPQTKQEPTEAPPSIASGGAAAGAQPSPQPTLAPEAPANDTANAPNTGSLRQAAGTPTPATYSAQIATSSSAASDTQALDQLPAPTPQASPRGSGASTLLILGALFLIVLGGILIWLFSRRKI